MEEEDPILQMLGIGAHVWAPEGGDAYIAWERSRWDVEVIAKAALTPLASEAAPRNPDA